MSEDFPVRRMIVRSGGAQVLTSHYVAAMALSRALNFVFWFHGYPELAVMEDEDAEEPVGSNWAGYAVVFAHVVQLALMADFLWRYIRIICGHVANGSGLCSRPSPGTGEPTRTGSG